MLESVVNKVAVLHFFCEYCKFFLSSFFHKTHTVGASKNPSISQENITNGGVIYLSIQ